MYFFCFLFGLRSLKIAHVLMRSLSSKYRRKTVIIFFENQVISSSVINGFLLKHSIIVFSFAMFLPFTEKWCTERVCG